MSKNNKNNENTVKLPVSYERFMETYFDRFEKYVQQYQARFPEKTVDYKKAHQYAQKNLLKDLMALDVNIKIITYPMMSVAASGNHNGLIYSKSKNNKPYVKEYKIPKNTKTPRKIQVNYEFKISSQAWNHESLSTQNRWRKFSIGKPQTGHSLYTQKYLKLLRAGKTIPSPLIP